MRLIVKTLIKRILKRRDVWDEATQRRSKELEYKLSVTKHSVRRKKLQQQIKLLKEIHYGKKAKMWVSDNGMWTVYLIPRPKIVNNKTDLVAYPLLIDGQIVLEDTYYNN